LIEVFVALTLVTTMLSLAAPLVVRLGRMSVAHRHYRIALDELTNQLDRLTALPTNEVPTAIQELSPSPFAIARLPGVKLGAQLNAADIGQRLTLTITWDELERDQAPLTLAAWIAAQAVPLAAEPTRENPQ
jgi:hypothetical protein